MKLLLKTMKFRWLSLKNDFTQTKFFLVLLVLFTASAGCISSAANLAEDNHGTLNINGSAVMSPMMTKEAAAFNAAYPAANVISGSSSSGAGIKDLFNGSIDIATTSQLPKKSEYTYAQSKRKTLYLTVIAYDALAVVVNPSNPVNDLSKDQLMGIFFHGNNH